MNLDEELRASITTYADALPPTDGLLDRVHRTRRRRAARRTVVAVVLAVAVIAAVPYALAGRPGSRPAPPIASVVPTSSGGPSFGPADMAIPDFPLTPGWVPHGAGARAVGIQGPMGVLTYLVVGLIVHVDTVPYMYDWEAGLIVPIDVNGMMGTLRTGDNVDTGGRNVAVAWRASDGRFVTVESIGQLAPDDVERFARALAPQPIPATVPPVVVTVVPAGWVLGFADRFGVCFAPADLVSLLRFSRSGVCASVDNPSEQSAIEYSGAATAVTVGGRPAALYDNDRAVIRLRFELGGGHHLDLSSSTMEEIPRLTRDDLLTIGAGVSARRN